MRALVISDTHFGAWTGEDLLREQANLDLLEPHLDVDEVIVLGDMFDFLFGSLSDAFGAAAGLLGLLRERLQGKRLLCLAGNHDHHLVTTEGEARLELHLTDQSRPPGQLLFTIAQVPNGTNTERSVYKTFEMLGRAVRRATAPRRALEAGAESARRRLGAVSSSIDRRNGTEADTYEGAQSHEMERRRRTGAPAGGEASSFVFARRIHPSDPTNAAVEAFDQVVANLGYAEDTNKIVSAHTHQPLDGILAPSGKCRYWNTGSWIYEPDLTSQRAYLAYLATPGPARLCSSIPIRTSPSCSDSANTSTPSTPCMEGKMGRERC